MRKPCIWACKCKNAHSKIHYILCLNQGSTYRCSFSKKLKKTFKKVLTKGVVRGIIVKRSRETAKNQKRKAWKESRLKESTGPWKLNNERKNGTCNFFERLKETYEKQNSTNLWRTSERRYERIKALKKIWARKRLDTIF